MKRFLLTLTVLFSAIFSLVAKPAPTDFGEKVHIGVHGEFAPILHQVDESTSVELHWVTQDNYLYDAIGSPVRPGSGRPSFDDIANNGVRNDLKAVGGRQALVNDDYITLYRGDYATSSDFLLSKYADEFGVNVSENRILKSNFDQLMENHAVSSDDPSIILNIFNFRP